MAKSSFFEQNITRMESKGCKECGGIGRIVKTKNNATIRQWSEEIECPTCLGTGLGEILPVEHADKALKKMIKICTPEFFRDIPFAAVKYAFLSNPTAETLYENEDEDILIIKLFEDVVICFKDKRVAWVEY